MTRYAILLRGVNVSGKNRLPMADFRTMLAEMGYEKPVTYIQSGNAVVDSDDPAARVAEGVGQGIAARFGFSTPVLVMTLDQMQAVLTGHRFADAAENRVHAFFLQGAQPGLTDRALAAHAAAGEEWQLLPDALMLHTPDGIGTSKLADRLPRMIAGPTTARNLRSLRAIVGLMRA